MKVSISKSVSRAFDALEIFRETRRPASATEIRRRLDCPHSSAVAILHNLVDIGYLSYDAQKRRYFPTYKLYKLGTWVPSAVGELADLEKLAAAIASKTGETTLLTGRSVMFLNIIHVVKGDREAGAQVSCGLGASLFRSTTGIVLLSQMADDQIRKLANYTNRWSKEANASLLCNADEAMAKVADVRKRGFAQGFDWPTVGLGTIAYPVPSPFEGSPLVMSVVGQSSRLEAQSAAIHRAFRSALERHNFEAPTLQAEETNSAPNFEPSARAAAFPKPGEKTVSVAA